METSPWLAPRAAVGHADQRKLAQADGRQQQAVGRLLPPPRFAGRLASVRVTPQGMVAVLGKPAAPAAPPVEAASYIYFQGGTLSFAKLTMRDTDLVIVPEDSSKPLAFSPTRYYAQLEAGHTEALPRFALAARVKDFRASSPARPAPR